MAYWVTPPSETSDGKQTAIGEVNFGSTSSMFVFAYRNKDNNNIITDKSIPAYHNIIDLTPTERNIYSESKYIIINGNNEPLSYSTDIPLKYTRNGIETDTGLVLSSNGQITGTLRISDSMKELVFKVKYIDPPVYTLDHRYNAYAHVQVNGRILRLKNDVTVPYIALTPTPDNDVWEDIGEYRSEFSVLPSYVNGTTYSLNSSVHYNNNIYQLSPAVETKFLTTTAVPNALYWKRLVEPYSGLPVYQNNTIYNIDDKVQYQSNNYQLIYTLPYVAFGAAPNLNFWLLKGPYNPVTANEAARIFRIVINTRRSSLIDFVTDTHLGIIKIGQQLGEQKVIDIKAVSDSLVTYELLPEHRNIFNVPYVKDVDGIFKKLPKGLTFNADGTIYGQAVGPIGTYHFDIIARNAVGLEKQQTFELQVYAGYAINTCKISLKPHFSIERDWYKMIADSAFSQCKLYRPSDANYGIRDYPEVIIKKNIKGEFVNTQLNFNTIHSLLREKLQPYNVITGRMGNMRYRTALNEDGVPLYDIVYKELLPLNTMLTYDTKRTTNYQTSINEITRLKTVITSLLKSDDISIEEDELRGVMTMVDGIETYDDLQLWASNPGTQYGAEIGYYAMIPVAYMLPGEAELFFDRAIEIESLQTMMINDILTFDTVTIRNELSEKESILLVPLRVE